MLGQFVNSSLQRLQNSISLIQIQLHCALYIHITIRLNMSAAKFLAENKEDADFNQYWYSPYTISKIVEDLANEGGRIGFLSTPSIYFSLPEEQRSKCYVFDVRTSCVLQL